jgi:hypothetical protein
MQLKKLLQKRRKEMNNYSTQKCAKECSWATAPAEWKTKCICHYNDETSLEMSRVTPIGKICDFGFMKQVRESQNTEGPFSCFNFYNNLFGFDDLDPIDHFATAQGFGRDVLFEGLAQMQGGRITAVHTMEDIESGRVQVPPEVLRRIREINAQQRQRK